MDTKIINRSVKGQPNLFPDVPVVHRVYVRSLSDNTYGNAVGLGLADVIHNRILEQVDWTPTYINSLTASTPAAIRTPVHFATDHEALAAIAPTVGKRKLAEVTYCRIRNTLELVDLAVSENLVPALSSHAQPASDPFEAPFTSGGDLVDFAEAPAPLMHV
jgi:hypothetical protein